MNFARALPYLLLATTVSAALLASYFWRQRQRAGGWITVCLVSCGAWSLVDGLSYLLDNPSAQDLLRRSASLAILAATFSFFRFACSYARLSRWWHRVRGIVLTALSVNLLLIFSNPVHQLIWRDSEWVDLGFARVPVMVLGPAFYALQLPLTYGLIVGALGALLAQAWGSQTFYVRRVVVLGLGLVTPLIVNALVLTQLTRGVDPTPVALLLSMATVAWVTLHDRFLDVTPMVRSRLFQQHRDGVIVLGSDYHVIDANPAAQRFLGSGDMCGAAVATVLPFWPQVRAAVEAADGGSTEVTYASAVVDIRASLIHDDKRRIIGRLVVLHDVTERVRLLRELDAYARTVAHDLKNPLSAVVGYLDLLQMSDAQLSGESLQRVSDAMEGCQNMAGIVDALLRRR